MGEPWQETAGEMRLAWVERHFHANGMQDCVPGAICHDLGHMPEVHGPLPRVTPASAEPGPVMTA